MKSIIIIYFFVATLSPYFFPISTKNEFLSHLIGAYQVVQSKNTGSTIFKNAKRIFIHSQSYLIVEDQKDNFQDYQINISEKTIYMQKKNKFINLKIQDDFIFLSDKDTHQFELKLHKIDLTHLPLRSDSFDWTVD